MINKRTTNCLLFLCVNGGCKLGLAYYTTQSKPSGTEVVAQACLYLSPSVFLNHAYSVVQLYLLSLPPASSVSLNLAEPGLFLWPYLGVALRGYACLYSKISKFVSTTGLAHSCMQTTCLCCWWFFFICKGNKLNSCGVLYHVQTFLSKEGCLWIFSLSYLTS